MSQKLVDFLANLETGISMYLSDLKEQNKFEQTNVEPSFMDFYCWLQLEREATVIK